MPIAQQWFRAWDQNQIRLGFLGILWSNSSLKPKNALILRIYIMTLFQPLNTKEKTCCSVGTLSRRPFVKIAKGKFQCLFL